jgi:hypothetical protein
MIVPHCETRAASPVRHTSHGFPVETVSARTSWYTSLTQRFTPFVKAPCSSHPQHQPWPLREGGDQVQLMRTASSCTRRSRRRVALAPQRRPTSPLPTSPSRARIAPTAAGLKLESTSETLASRATRNRLALFHRFSISAIIHWPAIKSIHT